MCIFSWTVVSPERDPAYVEISTISGVGRYNVRDGLALVASLIDNQNRYGIPRNLYADGMWDAYFRRR
jgi:hypothetical protein